MRALRVTIFVAVRQNLRALSILFMLFGILFSGALC